MVVRYIDRHVRLPQRAGEEGEGGGGVIWEQLFLGDFAGGVFYGVAPSTTCGVYCVFCFRALKTYHSGGMQTPARFIDVYINRELSCAFVHVRLFLILAFRVVRIGSTSLLGGATYTFAV